MRVARHILVSGRVQGVGYRAFVADLAARHGMAGWVRNRRDGTVEAVIAADAATLETVLSALRAGPPAARVADLVVTPAADPGTDGFQVLSTL